MTIIYVDFSATGGSNNGSSWSDAYTDFQSALNVATDGTQIWVAAGTYVPTKQTVGEDTRSATFNIPNGVEIYGGFSGSETFSNAEEQAEAIALRDLEANQTIFSGDLDGNDNNGSNIADNSYHVVTVANGVTSTLDGVIVQDGNTTILIDPSASTDGGGIQNSGTLLLRQVVVQKNVSGDDGGGIGNNGTLTIYNSTIANNVSVASSSDVSGGGGLINSSTANATIISSTFSGNTSQKNGGAIRNDGSLTIVGSTFSGNEALVSAGGILNTVGLVTITSSTITLNTATDVTESGAGAGVANAVTTASSFTIANSIIAGNTDYLTNSNDDLAGVFTTGGHNLIGTGAGAASFTDPDDVTGVTNPGLDSLNDNGGFNQTHQLQVSSLAVDAGSEAINTLFSLDEASLGVDLNNDGDQADTINTIGNLAFDQRGNGYDRVRDIENIGGNTTFIDIGAFELQECFLDGTLILTEDGEKPVEELAIGDRLPTLSGHLEPIKWIGQQTYHRATAHPLRSNPIHIKPGALGDNLPHRDLYVSPDHALLVDGLLINAGALANGTSIVQIQPEADSFTYYHIELQHHALLIAEGAAAESYLPQKQDRSTFNNAHEYAALYPDQHPLISLLPMNYPRVSSKRQLPRFVAKRLAKIGRSLSPTPHPQSA